MKKGLKLLFPTLLAVILLFTLIPGYSTVAATSLNTRLLVGYWHNFDNGTGIINLRNVSSKWDVINVAFGESGGDRCTMQFSPVTGSDADFKSDIAYLNSLGKKVVLSIGGQNGVVLLPDSASKQKFVNSMISIIDKYGFNGIDIDLESGIVLNGGDNDFKNPNTPQIVNLISAIREISDHYGSNFIVSMAPETAYVQGGYTAYGNIWGAYLPIIYGIRDKLTYIHVQHYNAGSGAGLDGKTYTQGTADYEVAMAEMLLHGFPIAGNSSNVFPALRQDQVMIGLPASAAAAPSGGYISPTEMKKALDYIIKGVSYGGTYKLVNSSGYTGFRGLMTWSINWDAKNNYEFSNNYRAYFDGVNPPPVTTVPAVPTGLSGASVSSSQINVSWNLVSNATSYDISVDGNIITNVTSPYQNKNLVADSNHTYMVRAVNSAGTSAWSSSITVKTQADNTNPGGVLAWAPNTAYKVGDLVTYNGITYVCLQGHTSLIGWEPPNVPALWKAQ
ncbi:carbohydrate-binding protein [Clostridium sp. 'White wine YQ']|uniref:carbohydrate-binding protein n=1 Tax=Clostridium sp. 'White wine YQ' TaxID=3027474 RepID=UPI002366C24D|nr:glycosyl hydrolase family 18 protein [Clostridium sp. 'White wine YQ']MDD7793918.1 glycosyl hydrolase family 18 protein [Clostridium sp. 'White wine YQ']